MTKEELLNEKEELLKQKEDLEKELDSAVGIENAFARSRTTDRLVIVNHLLNVIETNQIRLWR